MPVTNHAAPDARRAFAGRQLGNSSARVARKTKPHGRTKATRNKHFVGHFLGNVLFSVTAKKHFLAVTKKRTLQNKNKRAKETKNTANKQRVPHGPSKA